MSIALINQKITEAVTAQEAGDFETALSKLRSAKILMAGKPDSDFDDEKIMWDRNAIDRAIDDIRRAKVASQSSIVQVPVAPSGTRHCNRNDWG